MTSNTQKCDENRNKRKKEVENEASENPQLPCLEKTDVAFSEGSQSPYKPEPLEKVVNEMNKEIMNLLSKYAQILRKYWEHLKKKAEWILHSLAMEVPYN